MISKNRITRAAAIVLLALLACAVGSAQAITQSPNSGSNYLTISSSGTTYLYFIAQPTGYPQATSVYVTYFWSSQGTSSPNTLPTGCTEGTPAAWTGGASILTLTCVNPTPGQYNYSLHMYDSSGGSATQGYNITIT